MTRIRGTRWLAIGIWLTTLTLVVVAIVLTVGDPTTKSVDIPFIIGVVICVLSFGTIGAVIATQAPGNPIGWLYECAAFGLVLVMSASEYAFRGLGDLTALPAVPYVYWLNQAVTPIAMSLIPIALVLFPDGRLLSRRWRPILWSLIAAAVVGSFASAFLEGVFQVGDSAYVKNPFSIGSGGADRLWLLLVSLLLVGIVGSLSSVVVRYRRSEAEQRQQLRWLAAAVLVIGVAGVVAFAIGFLPETDVNAILRTIAVYVMLVAATIGLPAATAVAILRFRLYDLDLVVKKTVVFTIVAVFILLLYIAALALAAISTVGAIAGALILVVTFNTVRRRARKVADRIVYGKRATPFEVMSDFSERMGETYSIDDVLPRMTELLTGSTGASEARVWLRSGSRLQPVAASPPDAPTVADAVLGDRRAAPIVRGRHLLVPRDPPGRSARCAHAPDARERPDGPIQGAARARARLAGRAGAPQRGARAGPAGARAGAWWRHRTRNAAVWSATSTTGPSSSSSHCP